MTVDFSKLTTISDIINAKDGNDDVFTKEEKELFEGSLRSDIAQARKAAELLVRVKKANENKKADPKLIDDLEDEKEERNGRGSIIYRALNINNLLRDTVDYLVFVGRTDLPKDKAERQTKINELNKEIDQKRVERSKNNKGLSVLESEFKGLIEDKEEIKKVLTRKRALLTLLGGSPTATSMKYSGTRVDGTVVNDDDTPLSQIPITIKDYTDPANPTTSTITNVEDALIYANNCFNAIRDTAPNPELSTHATSLPANYFNNRVHQTRRSVTDYETSIGYGVLRALREFTLPKLEAIVDTLNVSDINVSKDDLKKYAKEIVEGSIHWHEEIGGKKGYHYNLSKETGEGWEKKYEAWKRTILKKKTTEYPYVRSIDWEHVFAFMNNVFKIDTSGKLINKPYLNNPNDTNYLAPKDKDKGWSEIVFVNGYAKNYAASGIKAIGWYAKQPNAEPIIKEQVKKASEFAKDADFASIIQVWHDLFSPFNDQATNKWKGTTGNEKYEMDYEFENGQNMLRFCLAMKEIFSGLGLSSQNDEFDDYLLELTAAKEEEVCATSQTLPTQNFEVGFRGAGNYLSFYEKVKEKKVWNKDYTISRSKRLSDLLEKDESRERLLDGEIDTLQKKIGEIKGKNAEIDVLIAAKRLEIKALQELEDVSEKNLPDKKTFFNDLYAKKANGKWLWLDIRSMKSALELIKTEMEAAGEDFQSEFGTKQTEINGVYDKVIPIVGKIYGEFEVIVNSTPDKLSSSGVKKILKDNDANEAKALLEKISGYFQELDNEIILDDNEKDTWNNQIKEAIKDPTKFKDDPAPNNAKLTEADLKAAFGGNVDDIVDSNLVKKWNDAAVKKDRIEKAIKEITGDDKKPKAEFIDHLKDNGLENGTKLTKTDDGELWKEFLGQEPEQVIKTIYTHWVETNKDDAKNEMKAEIKGTADADDEERLNMTNYGADKKDGDPDEKGMVKYYWEKAKGTPLSFYKVKEREEEKDDKEDTPEENKSWFIPNKNNILRPCVTYIGGTLVLVGILVAVFWDKVTGWWNGPAEEQGEKAEGGDEKEEENE